MEKLWSPWRSVYIDSFKDSDENSGCVFCKAQDEEINKDECLVFYKGKYNFMMMNLYPYNNGHLMIIPYRHISDYNELTHDELNEITDLNGKAIKVLKKIMSPHGFNFGANIGQAAGAGIHTHLHFHLVPRWNGDTNFMPVLGNVKIISQDLLETKNKIMEE
ncbi:MAG: HIT domain-containing protein, partial [Ignavibacteriae bacterium]|nr:HIT domain-containing protein [Ignavibacteriota bacterium]